jgi:hypothetical protein
MILYMIYLLSAITSGGARGRSVGVLAPPPPHPHIFFSKWGTQPRPLHQSMHTAIFIKRFQRIKKNKDTLNGRTKC